MSYLSFANTKMHEMTLSELKTASLGSWESIAPEIRPGNTKNPDGTLKPFYLNREFTLYPEDRFELVVTNNVDPYGNVPLAKLAIVGHVQWLGDHPIAPGARKVDFSADEEYRVTPMVQPFADILNTFTQGFDEWKVGASQSIFKKAFPPFGLGEGQIFKEFDLIYLRDDLMFWGARNIDGRGFDKEENRPTNLQVPLIRKK